MSSENEIKEILRSWLEGTITDEEQKVLDEWLSMSDANHELMNLLDESAEYVPLLGKLYQYDEQRVWGNIRKAAHERRRSAFVTALRRCSAVAAAVVMIAGGAWLVYHDKADKVARKSYVEQLAPGARGAVLTLSSGESVALEEVGDRMLVERNGARIEIESSGAAYHVDEQQPQTPVVLTNTISVPRGKEYSFTLSDGTQVWLNSESSIVFPVVFGVDRREVAVTGEVFFDVAKDGKRQFIVTTPDSTTVSVYGTAFNISAYASDGAVETTLVRGSVEVAKHDRRVMLEPGMQARVEQGGIFDVRRVDAEEYAAWTEGLFSFNDESLGSICRKLSRWYDIEIVPHGDAAKNMRYTGIVKRYETFAEMSRLLERTGQIKTDIKGDKVILYIED